MRKNCKRSRLISGKHRFLEVETSCRPCEKDTACLTKRGRVVRLGKHRAETQNIKQESGKRSGMKKKYISIHVRNGNQGPQLPLAH